MSSEREESYSEMLFGNIAVEQGFLAPAQLQECLQLQDASNRTGYRVQLGGILKRRGFLNDEQLEIVTRLQRRLQQTDRDVIFGRIAVTNELVSVEQIEEALIEQKSMEQPLPIGELLVRCGVIDAQQRDAVLRAQQRIRRDVSLQELEQRTAPEQGRFGPYELEREISRGGMGIIYKARHLNLGRTVALKTLSPEFAKKTDLIKRFIQEAQALAKLPHPNIVQVYNVGRFKGTYFLEMEYIEGEDILDLVEREGPLPLEQALAIVAPVAEALRAAWDKGIVHRDVKPENIMMASDGQIKLADFGIVKLTEEGQASSKTQVGEMVGSPYYIAPEQAKNSSDIDFRVDVYSLGATLFRLVTGRLVFEGHNSLEVIAKHLHQPLPRPEELEVAIDPEVYRVINYMMQKNPANRPESWAEVQQLFQDLAASRGCPNCGNKAMAPDDVICIECGYNRKTGVQLLTQIGQKRPKIQTRKRSAGRPAKPGPAGGAKKAATGETPRRRRRRRRR